MKSNLLKAEMVKNGVSGKQLSSTIGISESAFYRKLAGESEFTQGEIAAIANALRMTWDTVYSVFFEAEVSFPTQN